MDSTASPVLSCGLVKRFGGTVALAGVDLSLAPGTVTGLLGRNGAGKTTLIKCLLGLIQPTEGTCEVLGEASLDLSPGVKARIGYVPQEPELYPWMRVGQAIAYQGSFYPRWDEKLVAELLDRFELEPRKRVGALSVGQLQKLAILLALASGPEVLLLDEPVAALDPEGRRDFLRRLVEMVADGERTILLSTHITSDVERVCSHVAVLCRGSLLLHEDLDAFRDSLKELRLPGVSCPQSTLDSLPATLLRVQATPTGTVAVVRGNVAGCVEHLHRATGIVPAVVDLNLEDAFIELQADGRKQA